MYVAAVDATLGEPEWRTFVETHPFGHLVAPGDGATRDLPVVVPTQFVLEDLTVWLHLVRPNPIFAALAENPRVVLSIAGDWAFIPSAWKAVGEEDPLLGIPTTYYAAVQRRAVPPCTTSEKPQAAWLRSCDVSWSVCNQRSRSQTLRRLTRPNFERFSASPSRSTAWKRNSNTGEMSIRRTVALSSIGSDSATVRKTQPRPTMFCAGWHLRPETRSVRSASGVLTPGPCPGVLGGLGLWAPGLGYLFDRSREIGQRCRHLLAGMFGAVVTEHPAHQYGERPPAIHPRTR